MRTRIATAVLVVSVVALLFALVAWRSDAGRQPSADLVGAAVTTSRSLSTSTTSTPTSLITPPTNVARPFTAIPPSPPARLNIPTLGVDVAIVGVGLNPDGSMEIPGATEAGWYRLGPRPGASFGSAVIAAHIDYAGTKGAFFDLPKLQVGELLAVTDADGTVHGFVVTERFQVAKDKLPTDELFRSSGPATLTLITCGGTFDAGARHYRDNIVVRAVPA